MGGYHGGHGDFPRRYIELETRSKMDIEADPLGGGQPTDTGHLAVLDPNGGHVKTYIVEGCLRRKLTAVHLVRLDKGEELAQGTEVELSIDWDRRADHVCHSS